MGREYSELQPSTLPKSLAIPTRALGYTLHKIGALIVNGLRINVVLEWYIMRRDAWRYHATLMRSRCVARECEA